MRALPIAVLSLLLSACASMNSPMATNWEGRSANELIASQGSPNLITPAGNGNTLFSYTKETSKAYYPTTMTNPTTIVGPRGKAVAANLPQSPDGTNYVALKCTTTYEVNKQHVVISAASHGNGC